MPEVECHKTQFSISEVPLRRNVKRFRGELVFKAHRRLHHSTLVENNKEEEKESCKKLTSTSTLQIQFVRLDSDCQVLRHNSALLKDQKVSFQPYK